MKKISVLLLLLTLSVAKAQDGKLLSKNCVDLTDTPMWEKISIDGELKPQFEHFNRLEIYFITYLSDSLEVEAILMEPKQIGKFPLVIFNRGGNRDFAKLTVRTMLMYNAKLVAKGYVVVGSNLRKNDEFGGNDLHDILNLTITAKEIPKADTTKIGMFGWSRGGMMTYLSLKKSDKIKTAIIGNGATDLFNTLEFRPSMENVFSNCIPNYWENKETELRNRSAVHWASELDKNSSLLILAGTNDKRVNPVQARMMAQKLERIKCDFEFKEVETDHIFSDKRELLNEYVIDWFDKKLKNNE